jgi:hypothetical protein
MLLDHGDRWSLVMSVQVRLSAVAYRRTVDDRKCQTQSIEKVSHELICGVKMIDESERHQLDSPNRRGDEFFRTRRHCPTGFQAAVSSGRC